MKDETIMTGNVWKEELYYYHEWYCCLYAKALCLPCGVFAMAWFDFFRSSIMRTERICILAWGDSERRGGCVCAVSEDSRYILVCGDRRRLCVVLIDRRMAWIKIYVAVIYRIHICMYMQSAWFFVLLYTVRWGISWGKGNWTWLSWTWLDLNLSWTWIDLDFLLSLSPAKRQGRQTS